jgi:hypothetical protein
MIEFILSKINLLILVVALFSIISFFTINVGGIFLAGEVKQELDTYAYAINGMIVAPTTCDSKPISIPNKFSSFGNNIFYHLTISQYPDPNGIAGTRVIFAINDIKRPNTILAASSLTTQAEVVVLDLTNGIAPLLSGEELTLDAQAVPPLNAFYAVKSVKQGRTTLYLFPCAITAYGNTCPDAKVSVNEWLSTSGGLPFVC